MCVDGPCVDGMVVQENWRPSRPINVCRVVSVVGRTVFTPRQRRHLVVACDGHLRSVRVCRIRGSKDMALLLVMVALILLVLLLLLLSDVDGPVGMGRRESR